MPIHAVTPEDHLFTRSLSTIDRRPGKLYFMGSLPEERPVVSIVGTRRPTRYGQEVTFKLAKALASRGVVIVSGLALGVDALAHRGALEAGGLTVAILATDLHHITPRTNYDLARAILTKGGALVSEYETNLRPYASQLLERNRLVSGVADALIVTEATLRSGTTSTVNHALQQGKTVFAVPGNITSPTSQGCNKLIQQGALPLTSVEDVLDVLPLPKKPREQLALLGDTPAETTIMTLISSGIQDGDELLTQSKLSVTDYNVTLSMLEMKGIVQSQGGNWWGLR